MNSFQLSYLLRHDKRIEPFIDAEGFLNIDQLISMSPKPTTLDELQRITVADKKGRFEIRDHCIRAVNGHSVAIGNAGEPFVPTAPLYHLTNDDAIESIMKTGLSRQTRQFIHFYEQKPARDRHTRRRYRLLSIDPPKTNRFYRTVNGYVLSADVVPPQYIRVVES